MTILLLRLLRILLLLSTPRYCYHRYHRYYCYHCYYCYSYHRYHYCGLPLPSTAYSPPFSVEMAVVHFKRNLSFSSRR